MSTVSDSDIDGIIPIEEFHDYTEIFKNYELLKKNNMTSPILNRYEKAKIVGLRAQQLAMGSKPLVEPDIHTLDVISIAEKELKLKKIPFLIKRKVGKNMEYWKIEDLSID